MGPGSGDGAPRSTPQDHSPPSQLSTVGLAPDSVRPAAAGQCKQGGRQSSGRGEEEGRGEESTGRDRLDLGHMEGRMDTKGGGELQTACTGVNQSLNFNWPDEEGR